MSQVLSIRFSKSPSPKAEVFLNEWQRVGTWLSAADNTYELHSQSGDSLLLTFSEAELEITGYTQDDTFSFIEAFSKRHGGELLHEGEPLPQEQGMSSRWKALTPFAKAAGIVVIIILLPLLIVALPILLLVLFIRLAFHFFRLSRSSCAKP